MNKKQIIYVIVAIILLIVFKVFTAYITVQRFNSTFAQAIKPNMGTLKNSMDPRWFTEPDDSNISDFAKDFCIKQEDIPAFDGSEKSFGLITPDLDNFYEIYDSNKQKELFEQLEKDLNQASPVDFNKIKVELISHIKEMMKKDKNSNQPSTEESFSYPSAPKYRTLLSTARYWSVLSRAFEKNNDTDSSLILSHAIFYLMKDFETNYNNIRSTINKMINISIRNIACVSILFWASKPQYESKELSKAVAKDILDFVKADYPLSNNINNEMLFAEDAYRAIIKSVGWEMSGLENTKTYKELLEIFFKQPLEYIDKPIYEIKRELDNFKTIKENIYPELKGDITFKPFIIIFDNSNYLLKSLFVHTVPNIKSMKETYEENLAKMELAAIALAINSFNCYNNKLPKSMDELSKWFGEELPKNRLTGEPYEIKLEDKYFIRNEGIVGKYRNNGGFGFGFVK